MCGLAAPCSAAEGTRAGAVPVAAPPRGGVHFAPAFGFKGWEPVAIFRDRPARGHHGPGGRRPAAGAALQREEEIREGLRDRGAAEQVSVGWGEDLPHHVTPGV